MTLYFTSGTTGAPKMAEHTHGSLGFGHFVTARYWYTGKCNCFKMKTTRYDFILMSWPFQRIFHDNYTVLCNLGSMNDSLSYERINAVNQFCMENMVWLVKLNFCIHLLDCLVHAIFIYWTGIHVCILIELVIYVCIQKS